MAASRHSRSHRGRRSRRELNSRINVTPLVDVMLVLLIVFMIAAPLLSVGVPVELPKTDAKSMPSPQEPLTVTIDAEGKVFLQETEVPLDELTLRLEAMSENGFEERIYLRGDENGNYGPVMKVMARINAAGFTNIGLVTDPVAK